MIESVASIAMWSSVSEVFGVSVESRGATGKGERTLARREMLNLLGKCLILQSSWSGGLSGSCCSGAPTLRQIILKIMRQARNLDDLRRIVLGLTERGIHIVFVKENLTFTGEDSPKSNLLLSVMGAFAQFERELIRERQREGIAIARREGKYRGRKPSLTPARAAELRRRVADGDSKAALAREFGISRDTLYRYVPVKKRRAGKLAK
jgi:resolvase-like protein/helix-turn-helix resolvase-like protein